MADATLESIVENAEPVLAVYGRWPSFHDFEIVRVVFDRTLAEEPDGPHVTAYIHMWQIVGRRPDGRSFVFDKHRIVGLRFCSVGRHGFRWFNNQNAIDDTVVQTSADESGKLLFDIRLPSLHGAELQLICRRARVVSIEEGIPPDSVYARVGG